MANNENLISLADRTKEERQEIGRKGGLKTAENRRRRKSLKEELLALLEINDNNNKISLAILEKAINGDIQAFTTIRDTIGEKPVDKVEQEVTNTIRVDLDEE